MWLARLLAGLLRLIRKYCVVGSTPLIKSAFYAVRWELIRPEEREEGERKKDREMFKVILSVRVNTAHRRD